MSGVNLLEIWLLSRQFILVSAGDIVEGEIERSIWTGEAVRRRGVAV
jgi:hypothetical protein